MKQSFVTKGGIYTNAFRLFMFELHHEHGHTFRHLAETTQSLGVKPARGTTWTAGMIEQLIRKSNVRFS